ncbi:Zinc finger BED domain-containing protein DAYSLEEPER [Sesamum angolense]|uniref:Zinc finger BED domain-containing protein DAYSLEEPER n=1 Tax=Sesamum angolense TaxID=2727404 RepID=A0AAE1W7H2_9LAMI|nr:Zinc finger BED domain-containing protein DAYSLEEPER [Sesamum angolense]
MKNKKLSGGEELTSHVFRQQESRGELATMVILHDYPLLMVEHIGFRRYVASIQPCFNTVSRNTMKSDIIRIYNDEKVKCYQVLDKLNYRVAITTDMWTSSNTKKGYMAVTTYFVDDSWTLRSCILRFVYAPAPHVAEYALKFSNLELEHDQFSATKGTFLSGLFQKPHFLEKSHGIHKLATGSTAFDDGFPNLGWGKETKCLSSKFDDMGMELFGLGARFDDRGIAQKDLQGLNRVVHGIF